MPKYSDHYYSNTNQSKIVLLNFHNVYPICYVITWSAE